MRLGATGLLVLSGLLGLGVSGFAATPNNIGERVPPVTFRDGTAKPLPLSELRDKKAVVIVFLSFDCPVSTSYSQPLSILTRKYAAEDVAVVGVCTNEDI